MIKTDWHIFFDISLYGTLTFSVIIMFIDSIFILLTPIHYIAFMLYAGLLLNILVILFSKNKELYVKQVSNNQF